MNISVTPGFSKPFCVVLGKRWLLKFLFFHLNHDNFFGLYVRLSIFVLLAAKQKREIPTTDHDFNANKAELQPGSSKGVKEDFRSSICLESGGMCIKEFLLCNFFSGV